MDFRTQYPDFADVETHIVRARAQRSVFLAHLIADFGARFGAALAGLSRTMENGLAAERDRRAIEADAFLKRSVPRY